MILKFPDLKKRDDFLKRVRAERPHLVPLMSVSSLLPHIRLAHATATDADWIAYRLSDIGKAYANLKMDLASI